MYRTVAQLDFVQALLASFFPSLCTRLELPEPSVQGRPVYALRMRSGHGENRRGVLLIAGTHSRELMNPDMLIELALDLLVSYETGNDLVLGGRRWPAADVKLILETLDLYLVPCINPDGREFVMSGDGLWRKNRRDNPGTSCDGIDLNRNLDILWGVTEGQTSCAPCAETYCGPAVVSDPEPRNVRHLLDTYRIDCFVDVHSYSELVLYPWGHAPTQTTDPAKRFTTLPSGTCQPLADRAWKEYMDPRDLQRFKTVAQRVVDAIAAVRGGSTPPRPGSPCTRPPAPTATTPTPATSPAQASARSTATPSRPVPRRRRSRSRSTRPTPTRSRRSPSRAYSPWSSSASARSNCSAPACWAARTRSPTCAGSVTSFWPPPPPAASGSPCSSGSSPAAGGRARRRAAGR